MNIIRVLIADDHLIFRMGLRKLLGAEMDMVIVGEASDGMEALRMARRCLPQVILLDINMPVLGGLEVSQVVRMTHPEMKIVISTLHEEKEIARRALDAGAFGYVLKCGKEEDLLMAIRCAHRGQYFLTSSIHSSVLRTFQEERKKEPKDEGYGQLSERERVVVLLLVEGYTTAQIGDILCLSPGTVDKQRANILAKLRLDNLVELVKYAIGAGLIDPKNWRS